jgi:hypothetical protein
MPLWLRAASYTILAIVILTLVGLLAVSYTAVFCLLGGFVVAQVLLIILPRISKPGKWWLAIIFILLLAAIFIVTTLALSLINPPLVGIITCTPGQTEQETIVKEYHAVIEPVDFTQGIFQVSEEVTYLVERHTCVTAHRISTDVVEELTQISLPPRTVLSSSRGIFIRELQVTPLEGSALSGATCCFDQTTVELRDFPKDSFYEARDVQNPEIFPYLDTATIKWSSLSRREIVFAYIARSFYAMRSLVIPLVGVSYQSQWIIASVGLLVTAVITPVVKPMLLDLARNKLMSLFEKKPPLQEEGEKARLIVSARGDEKEIEVKRKPK